jgi:hypothetical protein
MINELLRYLTTLYQLQIIYRRMKPTDSGRAIAQADSRRLPTAAARVRFQIRSCGICGVQSGTEEGFILVLRFPLPILIPQNAPYSSGTGTIGRLVADVPSGLNFTPPHGI